MFNERRHQNERERGQQRSSQQPEVHERSIPNREDAPQSRYSGQPMRERGPPVGRNDRDGYRSRDGGRDRYQERPRYQDRHQDRPRERYSDRSSRDDRGYRGQDRWGQDRWGQERPRDYRDRDYRRREGRDGRSRDGRSRDGRSRYDQRRGGGDYRERRDDRRGPGGPGSGGRNEHLLRKNHPKTIPEDTPALETLRPKDSMWDKKDAKLFEGVSATIAKAAGMFPRPGLGPSVTDPEQIKKMAKRQKEIEKENVVSLSPNDSIVARRLVVSVGGSGDSDAEEADKRLHKFVESYLASTLIPGIEPSEYAIETKSIVGDKILIETKTSLVATILLCLSDLAFPELEDDGFSSPSFHFERPHEYVACALEIAGDVEEETITESSSLLCLRKIPYGTEKETIEELLAKYGKVGSLVLLMDKITFDSKGVAYVTFLSTKEPDLQKVAEALAKEAIEGDQIGCVRPCVNREHHYEQRVSVDSGNLVQVATASCTGIPEHSKSKVVRFLNCLGPADLASDATSKSIEDAFKTECQTAGPIVCVKIPRPSTSSVSAAGAARQNFLQEITETYGSIFVEYENEAAADKCLRTIAGRTFRGRVILGMFYSAADFTLIK